MGQWLGSMKTGSSHSLHRGSWGPPEPHGLIWNLVALEEKEMKGLGGVSLVDAVKKA